jgi:hydrogenase nickel incorporation protein HypB
MCVTCGCSGELGEEMHSHADGTVHSHAADHSHSHSHSHDPDHDPAAPEAPPAATPEFSRVPNLIRLEQDILARNNRGAAANRTWLRAAGVTAFNLVSSPGAGKTTLLERTIRELGLTIRVIEGDQETTRDADRIRAAGAQAVQINTGTGCHLDAEMVSKAMRQLELDAGSLLMIENVGNLVCPALFDLGEECKVAICSVTEGEDKPLKYPHLFRASRLLLINKIDLAPHVGFDRRKFASFVREVNPHLEMLEVSATRGDGMTEWYRWLRARLPPQLSAAPTAQEGRWITQA